ncbi:helix-turn-helix domain-containing protein [Antrihabitans stalactiti]|uniref:helix-turn-helix domain-containing protein n=1 Tax=Antrihabitans stalactiti TaxID=2584121 RepID=UPI00197E3FCA
MAKVVTVFREPWPEVMTLQEVADTAKVSTDTVRRWIKAGQGPRATLVGTRYRFRTAEVLSFLGISDEQAVEAAPLLGSAALQHRRTR